MVSKGVEIRTDIIAGRIGSCNLFGGIQGLDDGGNYGRRSIDVADGGGSSFGGGGVCSSSAS